MVNKPIKALILSHSSELSGAERSMVDLFDYWSRRGLIKPHFIIRRPIKNLAKELRHYGWEYSPIYYTNWSQRNPSPRAEDVFRNALYNTKAVFAIEQIIKQIKPDIVMTNTIVAPWAALAAYYERIPHIWFVREYGDIDHGHVIEIGREKMLQDIGTLSSLVVTNSKTLAKHIEPSIAEDKVTPLYTPFNIDALIKRSHGKADTPFKNKDSLKLVITGKVAANKGQAEAAEAVARLTKKGHEIELCVIGTPKEEGDDEPLKKIIKNNSLDDKVHLVGEQSNPLAILKYADVGIMASKQEAFGRVTFEYMVLGLPVVGANSGATPEMIDSYKNGFLYEQGNVDDLTEKLLKYANNKELIKEQGKASARKAQQMMRGMYNADELFSKVSIIVREGLDSSSQPLNFSHRWLEYPTIASQYIEDSHAVDLRTLVYHRIRHRSKWLYLTAFRGINFIRRGFKRSNSL